MKTLRYGLKQGVKNVGQNKMFSLAAIGTIAICLFLFGVFYALLSNFQNMMYSAEQTVGVTVFFDKDFPAEDIDAMAAKLRKHKYIKEVNYISPQEAWERFQKEMYAGEEELVEDTFGTDNPLKDSGSFEIYLTGISHQKEVVKHIKGLDGVRKVNSSGSVAKSLSNANRLVAYISLSIIILLLFVSVFLINTAVATGIRVRRDEISIMQMIGATESFIRAPFLVEGILLGILGSLPPLVILWVMYEKVVQFVLSHFSALSRWLQFVEPSEEFMVLIPLCVVLGVGIGFIGSALSVKRHLK